jgi:hypothetical protein
MRQPFEIRGTVIGLVAIAVVRLAGIRTWTDEDLGD